MDSLRYTCWVFCMAQIVIVSGRPEFGTAFEFPVTSTVDELAMELSDLFASLDDQLHFMVSGLIPNSESKRELLATFADDFSVKLKAISEQLVAATNSAANVNGTLNMVLDKYTELSSFYNSNANTFISAVTSQLGLYVSSELWSALDFIVKALPDVKVSVEMLRMALLNASAVESVPPGLLRALVTALRNVKAHLPLLVYVFQRVGVNFQTADTFLATFNQVEQTLPVEFQQDTDAFNSRVSELEAAVGTEFSSLELKFNNTNARLSTELTGDIEAQTNFVQLKADLQSFTASRSLFLKELKESVQLASAFYRQSVTYGVSQVYYSDGSNPINAPALQLAMQLVESSSFAEFCHSKFAALVSDLLPLGRIRLNECFDTELPRLRKLQELIETYALMVSYDLEDLWHNLKPCRSDCAASNCVSQIASSYAQLKAARDTNSMTKPVNFFTSALTASLNRIGLCFSRVNIFTFLNLVPSFEEQARSCIGAN
uniref:Protein TsetseEP domain-containing protein n=1 Tax=Anopheles christyi TaxID=43041 RepID=A0A182JTS0_9DIPT